MTDDPMRLETLAVLANEFEAALIVGTLEEEGIRAAAVGGYTSGFRAEAPGGVRVMVAQGDLARAREVLAEVRREQAQIARPEPDRDEEASPRKPRPVQYTLATLVALQIILSVGLAICRAGSFSPDVVGVTVALGTLLAVLVATLWIGSDMTRARAVVRLVMVTALAAVLLLELILIAADVLLP